MPSKKDLRNAKRAGVNPYAIAGAMENRGEIRGRAKKEEVVKAITRNAIKRGKRGK